MREEGSGRKSRMKYRRTSNVLARWIILGCITLMIPISCTVINYFYNLRLLKEQNDQINYFVLETVSTSADARLTELMRVAENIVANDNFSGYSLNVSNETAFLSKILQCYQTLSIDKNNSSGYEVLVYIPARKYVIDTNTANTLSYLYKTLVANGKISISYSEWKELLENPGSESYFTISRYFGYVNHGKECFVYAVPNLYVGSSESCWIYISVPTSFMDDILESNLSEEMTVLILDENDNVIGQYGKEIGLDEAAQIKMDSDDGKVLFSLDGESYVGVYEESSVASWTYLVCTPELVYMDAINTNRNINLLVTGVGAVLALILVILVQRNNYHPLKRLVSILPRDEEDETENEANEFGKIEKNLRRLYEENRQIVTSMEKRKEQDRESNLFSLIKGQSNYFVRWNKEELLGENYQEQYYAFVTISVDQESRQTAEGGAASMDQSLLWFIVDNVIGEMVGEDFHLIKTMDNETLVYLVIMKNAEERNRYELTVRDKFLQINEFFQVQLQTEIAVTLGTVIETGDHLESAYAHMEETNQQRYYTKPYGVICEDEVKEADFSSRGRLQYYSKNFSELAGTGNYEEGKQLSQEFFEEIKAADYPFHRMIYYVIDIVNYVLMEYQGGMQGEEKSEAALAQALEKIRQAENLRDLHREFNTFFKLICSAIDEDSKETEKLEEKVEHYVREHYSDCNMNISSIALEMGVTSRYMSQVFKEQMGVSLLTYINDERVEHAKTLLKTTSMTVEEIAEATGFTNARTFRRNFLKTTGMTAAQYRSLAGMTDS